MSEAIASFGIAGLQMSRAARCVARRLRVLTAFGTRPEAIEMASVVCALYICGLAFKSDVDDLRESPALETTRDLVASHPGLVRIVESNFTKLPAAMGQGELQQFDAVADTDIHILLVDQCEFLSRQKPAKITICMRGIWENQMGAA